LVIAVLAGGSDINKYLPGPHHDPPSKEKLKAMMDVITVFPFLPLRFSFVVFSMANRISCSSSSCSLNWKKVFLVYVLGNHKGMLA